MYLFELEVQFFLLDTQNKHSRFLSTDGPSVPVTASAKVFLLGSHDLLEGADIGSKWEFIPQNVMKN